MLHVDFSRDHVLADNAAQHLLSKVRYFAMADQIGTILEGPGRPLEGQVDAAWRRVKQLLRRRDDDM